MIDLSHVWKGIALQEYRTFNIAESEDEEVDVGGLEHESDEGDDDAGDDSSQKRRKQDLSRLLGSKLEKLIKRSPKRFAYTSTYLPTLATSL